MIVDIFAAFLIICFLILFAAAFSLAVTYWFISVPALILGFICYHKHYQSVQRAMPPEIRARKNAEHAKWVAEVNAEKAAKARRKAMYR